MLMLIQTSVDESALGSCRICEILPYLDGATSILPFHSIVESHQDPITLGVIRYGRARSDSMFIHSRR